MSNTSTVTPYESSSSQNVGATVAVAAVAAGAVAIGAWLVADTTADKDVRTRLDDERQREALGPGRGERLVATGERPARIESARLHLKSYDTLVLSAKRLGLKREPTPGGGSSGSEADVALLSGRNGERLALVRDSEGRVNVQATRRGQIDALVRQHTTDRVVEHLARVGVQAQVATLPTGEVQILARERDATSRDGHAEIRTHVRTDGSMTVDVSNIQGGRCRAIVEGMAEATGGTVVATHLKDEAFQLPGEPTKIRERL